MASYTAVELQHYRFDSNTPKGDGFEAVEEYVWIGPGGQPDSEHSYWG